MTEQHADLIQFAEGLSTARELWRSHREAVEAPQFPAALAAIYEAYLPYPAEDPNTSTVGVTLVAQNGDIL